MTSSTNTLLINLETYLFQQRQEGRAQGEGEFSFNVESALSRLGHFQLVREMGWVSVLGQSAVLWNCSHFEVRQSRYLTRFVLHFESGRVPDSQAILQSLPLLTLDPETGLGRFASAVQILLQQGRFPFQVRLCRGPGEVETLAYGQLTWWDRFRSLPANSVVLDINHAKPLRENLFPYSVIKGEQMAIRRELEGFAGLSPVAVTLDGLALEGCFGLTQADDGGQRVLVGLQFLSRPKSLATLPVPYRLLEMSQAKVSRVGLLVFGFRLPSVHESTSKPNSARRGRLCWVKSGVVVERVTFQVSTESMWFDLYLSSDGLESDLGGWRIVRNEQFRQRCRGALAELTKTLRVATTRHLSEKEIAQVETRDHKQSHPLIGSALFLALYAPMMAVGTLLSLSVIGLPVGLPLLGAGIFGYKHQPFKVNNVDLVRLSLVSFETDFKKLLACLTQSPDPATALELSPVKE